MPFPDVAEFTGVSTPLCVDPTVCGFCLYHSGLGRVGTLKVRQGLSNLESISISFPSAESMPGYGVSLSFSNLILCGVSLNPKRAANPNPLDYLRFLRPLPLETSTSSDPRFSSLAELEL